MNVAFYTLGCKVNHYETQAMEELFVKAGYSVVSFTEQADVYIVNTCSVTQMSDKKSRQMLHRAKALNPNAKIVAVGCYAETSFDAVSKMDDIDLVLGTEGRKDIVKFVESELNYHHTDPFSRREFELLSATKDARTRATLKIQDGCNRFCSYCIIPYARGTLRSRPLSNCKQELTELGRLGYSEVILTGIQLAAYGVGLEGNPDLLDVLELADSTQGILRVRLGSLEPTLIDDRFLSVASRSATLCPQFHLSLQSGSDSVLKRMNRRYDTELYRNAVRRLRETFPNCAITTDIIAGFVGETEEEHEQTMRFVEEIGFARIHVFPYSKRQGTKAAAMGGHLPKSVKDARAQQLIQLGTKLEEAFVEAQLGKTVHVLLEDDHTGFTDNYVRVRCEGECGSYQTVELYAREGTLALGR